MKLLLWRVRVVETGVGLNQGIGVITDAITSVMVIMAHAIYALYNILFKNSEITKLKIEQNETYAITRMMNNKTKPTIYL